MSKRKELEATSADAATAVELPEGWASTALQNVVALSKAKVEPTECPDSPYLSLEHIQSGTNRIESRGMASDVKSTKAVFRSGDILYGKLRPYLNKVAIPGFDGVCSTDILVLQPTSGALPEYLLRFLSQPAFVQFASAHQKGNSLPRVSFGDLADYPVPIPPLAEQKRIVAKVEALLERVGNARERLDRVPAIIKRFRQSVLAAACSGRLTADWREENPSENSNELVVQIDRCRCERYEENNSTRYQDSLELRIDQEYEFPESWPLVSLDRLTCLVTSGSRGWAKYYSDVGPLFVRAQNINTDELDLEDAAHVMPPDSAEGRRTRVRQHDLLITITGANVTKSAIVRSNIGEAYVSQHVAIARPVDPRIAAFLYLWVVSPAHGREKLTADAYGAGKPGLNLTNIRDMPVALPSLDEQGEIVRRVDRLLALANRVEASLAVGTRRTERITQSVLKKAFDGELVETEADLARLESRDYEPAWLLLERVKLEHSADKSTSKNGKVKEMAKRKATSERRALTEILAGVKSGLTPDQLIQKAGFDETTVEQFYRELRDAVRNGEIVEKRPNYADVRLVAKP